MKIGNSFADAILGAINGNKAANGPSPSFGQRLSAAALSSTEGYDKFIDEQNRLTAAGKSADYMRDALGDDAPMQMGIADEEWKNMGAREKAAAAQGFQQKQTIAQIMARTRLEQQQGEEGDAAGSLARNLVNNPDSPMWKNLPPGSADVLKGVAGAGPMNPRVAASVLTPIIKQWMGQGSTPSLGFQEDPVSGVRFATYGRELIPSGVNPDKAKPSTMMVDDGNGGQVPVLVNPKTGAGTALKSGAVTAQDQFRAASATNLQKMQKALTMIATPGLGTNELAQAQQMLQDAQTEQSDLIKNHPGSGAAKGKPMTVDLAKDYLKKAGGNKEKARKLAKDDGYTF